MPASKSSREPKLSLIICSRNRAKKLAQCLASIRHEEMEAVGGELVLINNGSTDETEQIMLKYQQEARFPVLLGSEPVPGLSRARNRGLLLSGGETIVFTDDDCSLAGGYLLLAGRIFESGAFDYCGGQTVLGDESDARVGYNTFDDYAILRPRKFIPAGTIQGANMLFHRRVVDKVGDFDCMLGAGTEFPSEDIDYVARASFAGFTGAKVPQLVVYHDHGRKPGTSENAILRAYDHGRGAYYAKFLMKGKVGFLFHWIWQSSFERTRDIPTELTGAWRYIVKRMTE